MDGNRRRVLYLDGYTLLDPKAGVPSSDAIGYGITASTAIREGLAACGFDVLAPRLGEYRTGRGEPEDRLSWILSTYRGVLRALAEDPPDVIFIFHVFSIFPVEIKRMLLDLHLSIPVVGYTHGSHWDPTDTFRTEAYPGLHVLDLANLHVLDRLLLVSQYMRTTLRAGIETCNAPLAGQIDARTAVVGLPLGIQRIDSCRTGRRSSRTTVVFNHAPVASKNADLFARVMARVLAHHDVTVLITRDFAAWQPGGEAIAELAARFPRQVVLGHDMPLDDYFNALWGADLQVSTATHESLGVSTLEAMYTGTCCVLPRLGSYPEICNGHPDVLYELGADALEERLRYFLEHPERRVAVAAELKAMTTPYHPRTVVQKISRELEDVMGRP
jgi:glycosyltransferase involved in cell wall biosynthesis